MVTVAGTDVAGEAEVASATVTVTQSPPAVSITGPALGFVGRSLTFAANDQLGTVSSPSYRWTLLNGDGSPYAGAALAGGQTTLSTFVVPGSLSAGDYQVSVSVSDGTGGAAESVTQTFDFSVLSVPTAGTLDLGAVPVDSGADVASRITNVVVRQSDGKLLVAGYDEWNATFNAPRSAYVARFNADFTLDTTFGSAHTGVIPLDFLNSPQFYSQAQVSAGVIDPANGDLVVVGNERYGPTVNFFYPQDVLGVAEIVTEPRVIDGRMVLPGSLDPDFNGGSPITLTSPNTDSAANAVTCTADGSILVGGAVATAPSPAGKQVMAGIDAEFKADFANIYSGTGYVGGFYTDLVPDFFLVKFTAQGELDASFGNAGVAEQPDLTQIPAYTPFSADPNAGPPAADGDALSYFITPPGGISSLIVSNGKILAGGTAWNVFLPRPGPSLGDEEPLVFGFALVSYTSDGRLDTTFGDPAASSTRTGYVYTSSSPFTGYADPTMGGATLSTMEVLPDGDILTAGVAGIQTDVDGQYEGGPSDPYLVLARYTPTGELDTSYGTQGVVRETSLADNGQTGPVDDSPFTGGEGSGIPFFVIPSFERAGAALTFATGGGFSGDLIAALNPTAQKGEVAVVAPDGTIDQRFGSSNTGALDLPVPLGPGSAAAWNLLPAVSNSAILVVGDDIYISGILTDTTADDTLDTLATGNSNYYSEPYRDEPIVVRYRPSAAPAADALAAVATAAGPVALTWSNSGYGQDGFQVERSTTLGGLASAGALLATVGPNQDDYLDAGAQPDTTYYYQVVPFSTGTTGQAVPGSATGLAAVHTLPASDGGYSLQEVVKVAVDGSAVTAVTPLKAGQTYLLVASGDVPLNGQFTADPAYWYSDTDAKAYGRAFGVTTDGVYDPTTYGVAVGDPLVNAGVAAVPDWGPPDARGHTYTTAYVGQGDNLTFHFDAAAYPSAAGVVPFQVEIWAVSPPPPAQPPVPPTPAGQPTLQVSVPEADSGSVPPVLSVAAPVDVVAQSTDGSPIPWTLWLVAPDGTTSTVGSSGGGTAPVIDPADHPDGIYTLRLTTAYPSPQQNYSTTTTLALEAPVVDITSPGPVRAGLPPVVDQNTPIDVLAAAPDGSSTPWALSLVSAQGSTTLLASGSGSAGQLPAGAAQVAVLDPAVYPNGAYTLRLTTTLAGQTNVTDDRPIDIETVAKVGNLSLPVTDATVNTAIGPVPVSRTYDTNQVGQANPLPGFGPGWTFDLIDAHLTTTARADTYDRGQTTPVLRAGDLVSLTVPDGGRQVFEFAPTPLGAAGEYGGSLTGLEYVPRFIAINGSGAVLTLPINTSTQAGQGYRAHFNGLLAYDASDDEYVLVSSQGDVPDTSADPLPEAIPPDDATGDLGFSPTLPEFDNEYHLTEADGTSYVVNATTGQIEGTTDKNGNTNTYTISSGAITGKGPKGQTLLTALTTTTAAGNVEITSVQVAGQSAPITYAYDAAGNLITVTNQVKDRTGYAYQFAGTSVPGHEHYLTSATNAAGATVFQAEYDPATGQLSAIVNTAGISEPVTVVALAGDEVAQTVVDAAGDVTQDVYGERFGTLDRTIQTVTDSNNHIADYVVTVTGHSYVTDDSGVMSSLYPSGVQVLQALRTYPSFEVGASDPNGQRYFLEPGADSWIKQVIYNTSDDPDDAASGQIESSSDRLTAATSTAAGSLQTTLYSDFQVVNATLGTDKPQVVTVELQTPDTASVTGYDDMVQSTTYVKYDDSGNELYSLTPVARDVPGSPIGTPTLTGGFPAEVYVNLAGPDIDYDTPTLELGWSQTAGAYQGVSGTVQLTMADTSLAARGSSATPVLGDLWTLRLSDAAFDGGSGIVGSVANLAFDGTPGGLAQCVTALMTGDRFGTPGHPSTSNGTADGFNLSVPGWVAQGTENFYTSAGDTPAGLVYMTQTVTATIDADGTVETPQPYGNPTSQTTYYGQGDYKQDQATGAWIPNAGAAYGAPEYTFDAAGQETFYAYDQAGHTLLQYVYKTWTTDTGDAASGWVGTTSVYDGAGRLTDTYTATYLDNSSDAGQTDHVLPVINGGPAGIQVDTSGDAAADTFYEGQAPLRTQHVDYNTLGQKANTVDQYGGQTTYTYDVNGNVIQTVNPDGTQALTVYDALNRAVWQTSTYLPGAGASTTAADPGQTTHTVYNSLGQVVETDQYTGTLITIGSQQVGSTTMPQAVLTTAGTLVASTQTFYDAQGNAIETETFNPGVAGDPVILRTGNIYTPDGKVLYTGPLAPSAPDRGHAVTIADGVTTQAYTTADFASYSETDPVQYDANLGLFYTRTVDPDGNATRTYTDTQGRTVRTAYADGSFTETLYGVGDQEVVADQEGDAVPEPTTWAGIPYQGGSETVSLAQRQPGDPIVPTYDVYDANGRLTDVYLPPVVDAGPNTYTGDQPVNPQWHYDYDSAGNEIDQVSGDGNAEWADPSAYTTSWAYDQNGDKVSQLDVILFLNRHGTLRTLAPRRSFNAIDKC